MVNEKMYGLGSKRSSIREIFEYAKVRSAEIGAENVFDFSIGNPSVPAPDIVNETIIRTVQEMPSVALHGYTSAQGDKSVRDTIAANYTKRFGVSLCGDDLYMTCGAAASLTVTCNALLGGIIVGAKAPIVLTSRGSTAEEKFYSIAIAVMVAEGAKR